MVLVEVFGHGIRIHFNVWKLCRMPLKVDLEISLGGESASADVALKGTLTCMRSYVDL